MFLFYFVDAVPCTRTGLQTRRALAGAGISVEDDASEPIYLGT